MNTPAYQVNNVVYLRESAAIGIIEAVMISGVHQYQNKWLYTIASRVGNPRGASVYGDRISFVNNQTLYFSEDELISLCDALAIAEANITRRLIAIQQQRNAVCPETTGTS